MTLSDCYSICEKIVSMPPLTKEEKAQHFSNIVGGVRRIGVSEFARGKEWRELLEESGCLEVTDRTGSIGVIMTPAYAEDLSEYINQLETELEQAYVRTLFDMRQDYSEPVGVPTLAAMALSEFDSHEEKIREFLDGSKQ